MRMAFWFFVWRQWLCDGDNGRYLDCFVNLMGPKIWIGSGLFLELYVPLPRLQLQIFFFLFRRKVTHTTYENETHLSFSLFFLIIVIFWFLLCALFNFDLVKLLYMHGFTRFSSLLLFYFIFLFSLKGFTPTISTIYIYLN